MVYTIVKHLDWNVLPRISTNKISLLMGSKDRQRVMIKYVFLSNMASLGNNLKSSYSVQGHLNILIIFTSM